MGLLSLFCFKINPLGYVDIATFFRAIFLVWFTLYKRAPVLGLLNEGDVCRTIAYNSSENKIWLRPNMEVYNFIYPSPNGLLTLIVGKVLAMN